MLQLEVEMNKSGMLTSTEISGLLGKKKCHINRDIRVMFPTEIKNGTIPKTVDQRSYVIDYHLPEYAAKKFMAKKSDSYIKHLIELSIEYRKKETQDVMQRVEQRRDDMRDIMCQISAYEGWIDDYGKEIIENYKGKMDNFTLKYIKKIDDLENEIEELKDRLECLTYDIDFN